MIKVNRGDSAVQYGLFAFVIQLEFLLVDYLMGERNEFI
jgi:hypothetical protein